MSVWCNRWYNEGFTALVLITGWEFFCIKIQKGTGHVSIRDVVKLKNTTSPNKKEEEEMYQKVSTDLKFVDREKKTEKNRLKSMVWSHLSHTVKRVSGNTKGCGKTSLRLLVSGQIWKIHM